jgi:hypothetical protein
MCDGERPRVMSTEREVALEHEFRSFLMFHCVVHYAVHSETFEILRHAIVFQLTTEHLRRDREMKISTSQ